MRRALAWVAIAGLLALPVEVGAAPDAVGKDATPQVASTERRPRLGVLAMTLTKELRQHYGAAPDRGVLVGRVEPGLAAAAAGIQVGDVIVEIDRRAIAVPDDVVSAVASRRVGDRIDLVVVRQASPLTITAVLMEKKLTPAELLRFFRSWPFGQWMRTDAGGYDQRCEA